MGVRYDYSEVYSSYNSKDKLSVCVLNHSNEKGSNEKPSGGQVSIFFVPEIGVSYRSYFKYFEKVLGKNIKKIITYDHHGNGGSGGVRGRNASIKNYLSDLKKVLFEKKKEVGGGKVFVFGHGFGANLALLAESEGKLDEVSGIIIENPFKFSIKNLGSDSNEISLISRIKRKIKRVDFFDRDSTFYSTYDELEFDYTCLNTKYLTVDVVKTIKDISKNVIERAYLTEKPILHFYTALQGDEKFEELVDLYQKGIGINKVRSIRLENVGYFDNFFTPKKKSILDLKKWIAQN